MNRKSSIKEMLIQTAISIVVMLLILMSTALARIKFDGEFLGLALNYSSLNGILTQIAMIMIMVMRVNFKRSKHLCQFLTLFYLLISCTSMILSRSLLPIPGVTTAIGFFIILEITDRHMIKIQKSEDMLAVQAYSDYLTGLPNRRSLVKRLDEYISEESDFALAIMEIGNFKAINDMLGHEAGDQVLLAIAKSMQELKNEKSHFFRMDGAEFAVIIENPASNEEIISILKLAAGIIQNAITSADKKFFAKINSGISLSRDGNSADKLLSSADMAMFNARQSPEHICFFSTEMADRLTKATETNSMIRDSIKDESFFAVYQPQFCARTKKLRGFEALVRMRGKDGNIVSPGLFIPAAERSSQIVDIDTLVLKNTLKNFKEIIKNGHPDLVLSVNMSVAHIASANFVEKIIKIVHEADFPTKNLELEVTESVMIHSVDDVIKKLNAIRAEGIQIALDDFGTGYASLSYLKNLPIDLLKIDKTFVDDIAQSSEASDFVNAIISLGHIMHFDVIAEGVEELTQLEILKVLGCDLIQGFIWGKPLELEKAIQLVEEN